MIIKSVDLREPLLAFVSPYIDEEMCKELANRKCNNCYGKGTLKRDNGSTIKQIIACNCVVKNYEKVRDSIDRQQRG